MVGEDGQPLTIEVDFPDRLAAAQIWEVRCGRVPLYLIDSNVPSNSASDQMLTARLYWADPDRRIRTGGRRCIRAHSGTPWQNRDLSVGGVADGGHALAEQEPRSDLRRQSAVRCSREINTAGGAGWFHGF